ncbi:MAG: NAD(P)H-hydrate dehydratase [Chitinophagaceae bacterium]|nr:MAG: NAD(P)H-hydrate dehydratase [Chitinophagaceae bacterium]
MKIPTSEQLKAWDQFTIQQEPIAAIDLMERAAEKCCTWITENMGAKQEFSIFCGKGNNGGDGLAIARLLLKKAKVVAVYILESDSNGTEEFQKNFLRLKEIDSSNIFFISQKNDFPILPNDIIIIDTLLGSGLSRPIDGLAKDVIENINSSNCTIISIDIPSGLAVDQNSNGNTTINATDTLSFQCYKPAFLIADNKAAIGNVHILEIGLDPTFLDSIETESELVDETLINAIYKPRNRFAHKGNFGHSLLIAGSYGKMGAALLAAKACLRSGVGLLSCFIPKSGYEIMQSQLPEAMVQTDINSSLLTKIDLNNSNFSAIGIGPGIGTASETKQALKKFLQINSNPLIVDADALNIIAEEKKLLEVLSSFSIITPHQKEFERLFGICTNDYERIKVASQKAKEFNLIVVLKGHHTLIATPDGKKFFNTTGNAGMATAGSGDVLTGIITGLLAQEYNSQQAALLGVYLHGLAGDIAAEKFTQEALLATDIVNSISLAFKEVSKKALSNHLNTSLNKSS